MPLKKTLTKYLKKVDASSPLRLVAIFVVLGFSLGSIFAYHAADNFYHIVKGYTSPADNFKIRFPGKPSVSQLPSENAAAEGTETGTVYDYADKSSGNEYVVEATKYSNLNSASMSEDDLISLLLSAVQQTASTDKTTVSNDKFVNFKGLTASQASLSPSSGSSSDYLLMFFRGNTLYALQVTGLSQTKFNSFTASFSFLGPEP